jgi:hypothetical protein
VRLMLAAKRAEFVELQPFGGGLLIFGLAIVLPLALSALQSNNFAHCYSLLLNYFRYSSCAHGSATFSNGEP